MAAYSYCLDSGGLQGPEGWQRTLHMGWSEAAGGDREGNGSISHRLPWKGIGEGK